jgi:hypothetical protein
MKALLIALILILAPIAVVSAHTAAVLPSSFWEPNSEIKVYFVRGLFTPAQKQVLWSALDEWRLKTGAGNGIKFTDAGETDGLIDCVSCLTLTRHSIYSSAASQKIPFNLLRSQKSGRIISAWIGLNNAVRDRAKLRGSLVQALAGVYVPATASASVSTVHEPSHRIQ